jgi:hypothetical protein
MTEITEERLQEAGFEFVDLGDESPFEMWEKCGIEVWDCDGHWVIDMLDQACLNSPEYHHMEELQAFFQAAKQEW